MEGGKEGGKMAMRQKRLGEVVNASVRVEGEPEAAGGGSTGRAQLGRR